MWVPAVLREIPRRAATSPVHLARRQARGPGPAGLTPFHARRGQHGVGGVGVETPGPDLAVQRAGSRLRGQGGTVGTRFEHGPVRTGRGQGPPRRRHAAPPVPGVVPTAVLALVRERQDRTDPAELRGPDQHPFRGVRAEPDAFPLGDRQRPRVVENGHGHAVQTDVVDEAGPVQDRPVPGEKQPRRSG